MAASARRGLMDLAISRGLVPAGTGCLLPSGRVISISLIRKFQRNTRARCGKPEPRHLERCEHQVCALLARSTGRQQLPHPVITNEAPPQTDEVYCFLAESWRIWAGLLGELGGLSVSAVWNPR